MSRGVPISAHQVLALAFAIGVWAPPGIAQATAEYTVGASKSAIGATEFGNTMNRSLSKAAGKVAGDLKTHVHEDPAQAMKENRAALEKGAGTAGGTLHLTSDPSDAAIFIDGRLVARTPAEINIPAGKHAIMIARPDRDQWTDQVTLTKGQTLVVNAKLVNTNPSVITLDFRSAKK